MLWIFRTISNGIIVCSSDSANSTPSMSATRLILGTTSRYPDVLTTMKNSSQKLRKPEILHLRQTVASLLFSRSQSSIARLGTLDLGGRASLTIMFYDYLDFRQLGVQRILNCSILFFTSGTMVGRRSLREADFTRDKSLRSNLA